MKADRIKKYMEGHTAEFFMLILIMQPLLDVTSYWAERVGTTAYTTALRFLMLLVIVTWSFIITDEKKTMLLSFGLIISYWMLHMLNAFRKGYLSPISDTANFIRMIQMPVLTLSFIIFLRKGSRMRDRIPAAFLFNLLLILFVIVLSFLTGTQVHTYTLSRIGVMGWFAVHNAQSAIVTLLVPLILYHAYRTKKPGFFVMVCILSFANLYFVGTKLAFYSIFLIASGMVILFLLNKSRALIPYISLVMVMVTAGFFYSDSPMYQVRQFHIRVMENRQEMIEERDVERDEIGTPEAPESRRSLPVRPAVVRTLDNTGGRLSRTLDGNEPLPTRLQTVSEMITPPAQVTPMNNDLERMASLYEPYLGDVIDSFGLSRVLDIYGETKDVSILADQRKKKLAFAALAWKEQDILTKLVGYEYDTLITAQGIYDLENDFHAIFYFYGYIGFGSYIAFMGWFIFLIAQNLMRNFRKTLTVEMGTVIITLGLMLLAAHFSGNVLRRPNVSIYLSLILAYSFHLSSALPEIRLGQGMMTK